MNRSTTSLIDAVRARNYALVEDFLESGASANERDEPTGENLLAIASGLGDARLVKLLLDAGADANSTSTGWPLNIAAGQGHLDVVELLLDAEADVDVVDEDGGTALESAACGGHCQIVSLLIEAGANAKHKDKDGKSALIYAAERGHDGIVAELMPLSTPKSRQQAEILLKLKSQGEPSPQVLSFFAATEKGDLDQVRHYLDEGGDIEVINEAGGTALAIAAGANQLEVVKLLVERGANTKHIDANGLSPVAYAYGRPAVFNYLFPLTPTKLRKSVEAYAHIAPVIDERLAALQRKLQEQGPADDTIVSYLNSARRGKLDEVQAYLKNGGRVDALDDQGMTGLIWASYSGNLDVVKLLVAAGADVNHMNNEQNFALLAAGGRNHCFVYFYLQPLTEKPLRDFADAFVKSRNVWWM
jgi:uncharacterized protein